MKSSLNFEELLKALGEFWFWDLLLFKCLNKQVCCPLIDTWNTNSDNFTNKINVKDVNSAADFIQDLQFQILGLVLCSTFEHR